MRVSGIKGGAPRASRLPQDMLYTFYVKSFLKGRGNSCYTRGTNIGCGTSILIQYTVRSRTHAWTDTTQQSPCWWDVRALVISTQSVSRVYV